MYYNKTVYFKSEYVVFKYINISAFNMDHINYFKKIIFLIICICNNGCLCKYLEGEIRTSEDWAFLARFCFLSEQGMFEFYFEFKEDIGNPNLLLYYDAPEQWNSVYKTDKSCRQKESVLSIKANQIVNLTTSFYDAGCVPHILGDNTKNDKSLYTTPKPQKAVTLTVNLNGDRKYFTIPMTTPTSMDNTTYENVTSFNGTLEDFDYYNTTDLYDFNNNNNNKNIDNNTDFYEVENLFGENMYNESDFDVTGRPIPIQKRSVLSSSSNNNKKHNTILTCRNARKFKSSRARWWFIAISNCDVNKGIHIKYQILMTNGRPGDYWHEHFSADEFYILPVLMAFSIAYGMLLFSIIICSVELKSRQLLHTTYKIFVLSVLLQLAGIGLTSMAYLKYAVSGVLPYRTKVLGGMFMGACETIFLLLLLLLAKGYTTTRGRLPLSASVKLTIFMCLYAITYLTLFIYEAKAFDPGEVLYIYESPAGYGLIVLRIIAWWMFIYSTIFTLKHYPEKSNFYYPFNICGTLWFVAGPAFILSANSYIDKWVRESVVCGVLLFITFAGHLMFLILTLPAMANKNFPYHIRTTQIGVMEVQGIAGASTIDQFSHHVYQPTTIEQAVIIPLHPHSDDIFTTTQRLPRIQEPRDSDDENSDEETKRDNKNIDNVLKWSTVKGYVSPLANGETSRTGSSRSNTTNQEFTNGTLANSPGGIFRAKNLNANAPPAPLDDWIKEVPVELFTISKMVINKTKADT